MSEKVIPHNIEAEQAILGGILIDPAIYDLVADHLTARDFYRDSHRTIYEAIVALWERRVTPDYLTICDELERRNRLEDAGGSDYITSLVNGLPAIGNIDYYAEIVTRTATLRRVIHAAGYAAAVAYNQGENALEEAERAMTEALSQHGRHDFATAAEVISDHYHDMERMREHQLVGVSTGFVELDHLLGGLQRSDLDILAARPGMGKSSMMLSIAHRAVYGPAQACVAIFSLEMSRKQLMQRLLSFESHISLYRLRNAHIADEEWGALTDAHGRLSTDRLVIDDTGGITVQELRRKARRLKAQQGLDLIIVDYLQLMHADGNKNYNREQEVAEVSKGLKELAKELDVPVLALAQLSRAVENRQEKRPQLSDLRESGSIENDADVVMFLYREGYYGSPDPKKQPDLTATELIIAKQRNGPVGMIPLRFVPAETRFTEVEEARA